MLVFVFIRFIFSLDESLFGNGCLCSVTPDECTPYCACDPFCTDAEKRSFHFTIPQKLTENNVACDTKHRIRKFRSKSVSTFKAAIEGEQPTCYYYQSEFKKSQAIKSYTPQDFGLEGFADAIRLDSPGIIIEVDNPLDDGAARPPVTEPETTDPNDGYLRGKPIKDNNKNIIYINNDLYMPLLFGIDSDYVFNFEIKSANDLDDAFNLSKKDISPDSANPFPAIVYTNSINVNANAKSIDVFWTIFSQKVGTNLKYRYFIRKVKTEYIGPQGTGDYTTHIHVKFIELSSDGNSVFTAKEESLFSYSFKRFFTSVFGRDEDSLKTAGILFCIGFLWTMWAYYSFFFSRE